MINEPTPAIVSRDPQDQRPLPWRALISHLIRGAVVAGALGAPWLTQAALVNEWRADDYTSGSWVDHIGSVSATANGVPYVLANGFNSHKGIYPNGGLFNIPTNTAPAGLNNFTVVVAFDPAYAGSLNNGYWAAQDLIGFDIGGAGQQDWGLSWGGNGLQVVTGVGSQTVVGSPNGDQLQITPALALNHAHVVALQVHTDPILGTNVVLYADGAAVATNAAVNFTPRSAVTIATVGGGLGGGSFNGNIADIQIYNDSSTNAALITQNLLTLYGTGSPITLPAGTGGLVGHNAALAIGIPPGSTAGGPLTVTLTSLNAAVVASTSVVFPLGTSNLTVNLPILGAGESRLFATATGVGTAVTYVGGVDNTGLMNQWVADDYHPGDSAWIDRIGNVSAAANGTPTVVTNAFGSHNAVKGDGAAVGFQIPAGTAPGGLTSYTVAGVFKPLAAGVGGGAYYGGGLIVGYDIGGAGQPDWGVSWGGQSVVTGIGRNGGDTGITAPGPYALNLPHAFVLQVNGDTGTYSLYVDGVPIQTVGGLTIIAPDANHIIPLISSLNANIGTSFPGQLAEYRVYANGTVDGVGLSALLLNSYATLPPIMLTSLGQSFVDVAPGAHAVISVGVPNGTTLGAPYTVTLTSDNAGVVLSTNVTLAVGATSTNLTLPILDIGSASLTATGSGLSSAAISVGGLAPRRLTEDFLAANLASLNGGTPPNNGDPISSWAGSSNANLVATAPGTSPIFVASATQAGTPAIAFSSSPLDLAPPLDPTQNPIYGTNFSLVIVYTTAVGSQTPGAGWYNGPSPVTAEEGGVQNDWGTIIYNGGQFAFGVGAPDGTYFVTNYNTADSLFHVAVGAFDQENGQVRVSVDDKAPTVVNVSNGSSRNNAQIRIGDVGFSGNIAEIRFYSGALTLTEATNVINSLKATYALPWPDQSVITVGSDYSGGKPGETVNVTVTIPPGINASVPITVHVTNSHPSAVSLSSDPSPLILTFSAGATNVQTFVASLVAPGSSILSAGGSGLLGTSLGLTTLPPAYLKDALRASSLTNQGYSDGASVTSWATDTNALAAQQVSDGAPTFVANATPTGGSAVVFDGSQNQALVFVGGFGGSPITGESNFTVVVVFKSFTNGVGSGQWYAETGIIDAEQGGPQNDWGIALDQNGALNFGVGLPDQTVAGYPFVTTNSYHVAVLTDYSTRQEISVSVDNNSAVTAFGGVGTAPRNQADCRLGHGTAGGSYFSGAIAEADFYSGALDDNQAGSAVRALAAQYGITLPGPTVSLDTPVNGSSYLAPATIPLQATVTTNGNIINSVTFYTNAVQVAVVSNAPYTYSLTGVGVGSYNISAKVTYNGTNTVNSITAAVSVNPANVEVGIASISGGRFVLSWPTGLLLEATNLTGPWVTNTASSPYTNTPNAPEEFYKIKVQ